MRVRVTAPHGFGDSIGDTRSPPVSEAGGQRGYFSPGSAVWQIARESVLMLGGGYALLMQAAHPLVAAGIAAHSSFRESPWRRLAGTMSAIYTVVYGTKAEADWTAARVRAIHAGVQGSIPAQLGLYPAGTGVGFVNSVVADFQGNPNSRALTSGRACAPERRTRATTRAGSVERVRRSFLSALHVPDEAKAGLASR